MFKQKYVLQDISMGGGEFGGGTDYAQTSKRQISDLKEELEKVSDENIILLKENAKLKKLLDKQLKRMKVYI